MNEPGLDVGLFFLAIILGLLVIPATVIAAAARWGSPSFWGLLFKGILVVAALAVLASFGITDENPGNQSLYRGLVYGFAISTAVAAWVTNRLRHATPRPGFVPFIGAAIGTQIVSAMIVIVASC
jgi:hypothetical protein